MSTDKLRIVIVEDQGIIAMLLSEVLEQLGHEIVAVAATEAGAVEAAARFNPGLMIVDDGLGAGSGVTAVGEVLRKGFVPHVFVSGDPAKVRTLSREAVVLEKPFSETELVDAIDRALRVASSRLTTSSGRSMVMGISPHDPEVGARRLQGPFG